MGSVSIWHWMIVLVIVTMVFGTKKLRNLGTDLGGAVKDFKSGMREVDIPQQLPTEVDITERASQGAGYPRV